MALCEACGQPMKRGVGCTDPVYEYPDGTVLARIPYEGTQPCHDCAVPPGTLHHPGCDAEECPRCRGQAIGCDCE
jgi:hypothetical protein